MQPPIIYTPQFIKEPDLLFSQLKKLDWQRRGSTPRLEYYINQFQVPYTYGQGRGVREYLPQPTTQEIRQLTSELKGLTHADLEVCFLNRYLDQSDHLGWHADDSPEMDDERPIAIISLGAEREIWFAPQNDLKSVTKLKLAHGSLCLMQPGMQQAWFHRIPKAGFVCGERISLTFRGYNRP